MTTHSLGGGEYLIKYSLSEYQHGSLVARFDSEPKEADARRHLAAYGIAPDMATSISIQPLDTGGEHKGASPKSSLASVSGSRSDATRARSWNISVDDEVIRLVMKAIPFIFMFLIVLAAEIGLISPWYG